MATYKIIRKYAKGYKSRVIERGLTLEEAQAWCKDPETSSHTCSEPRNVRRTRQVGPWFDAYTEE